MSSQVNRFCHLRNQKFRFLNHLQFLLRCKRERILPKCCYIKTNLHKSFHVKKALNRSSFTLLRATIKDTRSRIAHIEQELYPLHLMVAKTASNFNKMEPQAWKRSFYLAEKHKRNQNRKLTRLQTTSSNVNAAHLPNIQMPFVRNISNTPLSETEEKVIALGSNFAVSRAVHWSKIIAPVEKSLKFSKLQPGQKEALRHLISNTIQANSNVNIKPNLSKEEIRVTTDLKQRNLIVCRADKGNQMVVMTNQQYSDGANQLLQDGPYVKLNKDPADNYLCNIRKEVKACKIFSDYTKKQLIPSHSNAARFYALPKVHKIGIPFRPIVSNIGTASYSTSKFLAAIFSQLAAGNSYTVRNSLEFINKIKTVSAENVSMCSFDIKSLYTNIPVDDALKCLETRLREFHFSQYEVTELIRLTQTCLNQTAFQYNNDHYRQTEGLAMGDPLAAIMADCYMHYFESKLLTTLNVKFWTRFVDDTFVLIQDPVPHTQNILDHMNAIDRNIQFTCEQESNNSLAFLDVLVTRQQGKFETSVYRKPFAVCTPPHSNSCLPLKHKMAAFHSYVRRAITHCSTRDSLCTELTFLKSVAISRGYQPSIVDHIFRKLSIPRTDTTLTPDCSTSLKNFVVLPFIPHVSTDIAKILKQFDFAVVFTPTNKFQFSQLKDNIATPNSWGIYQIDCQCGAAYIGQTRRALKYRRKEHEAYVRKQELSKSSIAKHCWELDHKFKFEEAKIICRTFDTGELDFLEAFCIHKNINQLVNDCTAIPFFSQAWGSLQH